MVSLWPFGRGDDAASVAAFEKTLSSLSAKIKDTTAHRDRLRTRARRFKALWTLYTSLIYIVFLLIALLVTGFANWTPVEYTAAAAGPVVIYGVRTVLNYYYDYRIGSQKAYLADLHKQREAAIDKFKTATKYNSTQEVLERYGAAPKANARKDDTSQADKATNSPRRRQSTNDIKPALQPLQRTNLAPPPTANIQRPSTAHGSPQAVPPHQRSPNLNQQRPQSEFIPSNISFADGQAAAAQQQGRPHSLSITTPAELTTPGGLEPPVASPQYLTPGGRTSAWYDRLLDVLLGDDETKPINRVALICAHCRLVNGQAPPGVRDLAEVGRWRCGACKQWNGVEPGASGSSAEVDKILKSVQQDRTSNGRGEGRGGETGDAEQEMVQKKQPSPQQHDEPILLPDSVADVDADADDEPTVRQRTTRSKTASAKAAGAAAADNNQDNEEP